jgi:hypothetical protein
VDRDDGPEAARAVVAEHDLLVLAAEIEDIDAGRGDSRHGVDPLLVRAAAGCAGLVGAVEGW